MKSPAMAQIPTGFKGIASHPNATCSFTATTSILEHLHDSLDAWEDNLKCALEMALGSLETLWGDL